MTSDVFSVSYTHTFLPGDYPVSFTHPDLTSEVWSITCAKDAITLKQENAYPKVVTCAAAVRLRVAVDEPVHFGCFEFAQEDGRVFLKYCLDGKITLSSWRSPKYKCTVWITTSKDVDLHKYLSQEFPSTSSGRSAPRAPVAALWDKRPLSDVTLQVEGEDLPAHKAVLTACSPVFEAMFAHDFRESKENVVVIPDISLEAMTAALRYLYTAQLDAPDAKLDVELVEVSERYSLHELQKVAEDGLAGLVMDTQDTGLAITLLRTSMRYSLKTLQAACETVLVMKRGERDVDLMVLADECAAEALRKVMLVRLATLPMEAIEGWWEFADAQPELEAEIVQKRMQITTLAGCLKEG